MRRSVQAPKCPCAETVVVLDRILMYSPNYFTWHVVIAKVIPNIINKNAKQGSIWTLAEREICAGYLSHTMFKSEIRR